MLYLYCIKNNLWRWKHSERQKIDVFYEDSDYLDRDMRWGDLFVLVADDNREIL